VLGFVYFGPNDDGSRWARGLVYECRHHARKHIVEFRPVIGSPLREDTDAAMGAQPLVTGNPWWIRTEGDTPETITLVPSIVQACCHAMITQGKVLP